jgi:broad specificity phosphatase PhoE
MTYVRLIRHGESAANAGEATYDPELIPLTSKGVEQALTVAQSFWSPPNLIISSPFARARATAAPTIEVYREAVVEIWPIQEFTYLEVSRCANTTTAARRPWVESYWEQADPDYRDGSGAETFRELIERAQTFLTRLEASGHDSIAVFAHGQFISAVAWIIENNPGQVDTSEMQSYRQYEQANSIANCWGYELSRGTNGEWRLGHQTNPHGARCQDGEPLPVCGTMLLYAGRIKLSDSWAEPSDTDNEPDGPIFI